MYPEVSLADARRQRDAARVVLARGEDPGEAKKEAERAASLRNTETFEKQAEAYKAKLLVENKAPATRDKSAWLLDTAIAEFGDARISQITTLMALQCLRKGEAKGNYETAKRLRSKIGAVFRLELPRWGMGSDPIDDVRACVTRKSEQMEETLAVGASAEIAALTAKLTETEEQVHAPVVGPATATAVRELRRRIAVASGRGAQQRDRVFSHLLTFFSRSYDKGDFISQRRSKGDTYAIPYSGEEVVLHWANRDQYYT